MTRHLQAVILNDPPELGVSQWLSDHTFLDGWSVSTDDKSISSEWYPLPEPTPAAADTVLRNLHLGRLGEWIVQSGEQVPRLLFVANLQQLPQWLGAKAEPRPSVSPQGLDGERK